MSSPLPKGSTPAAPPVRPEEPAALRCSSGGGAERQQMADGGSPAARGLSVMCGCIQRLRRDGRKEPQKLLLRGLRLRRSPPPPAAPKETLQRLQILFLSESAAEI